MKKYILIHEWNLGLDSGESRISFEKYSEALSKFNALKLCILSDDIKLPYSFETENYFTVYEKETSNINRQTLFIMESI